MRAFSPGEGSRSIALAHNFRSRSTAEGPKSIPLRLTPAEPKTTLPTMVAVRRSGGGRAEASAHRDMFDPLGPERPIRGAVPTRSDLKGFNFRFIDLFAGIGGMRLGFESAGGQCVFTSEWNEKAQQTYRANFPCDHELAGDIHEVAAETIPPFDLLVAGFPCQPFSLAGVSKKNSLGRPHGFACETQGTLFFEIARILAHHRPPAFLLENVKHLERHDRGRTFQVIRDVLERDLRYHVDFRVIDAGPFVPQHRERIFIVGFRDSDDYHLDQVKLPAVRPTLGSILHPEDGTENQEPPYTEGEDARVGRRYGLTPGLWKYLQAYAEKHRAKGNGFGCSVFDGDGVARTLSARYHKDGSEILIRRPRTTPRRLTPRECARLMGFDRGRRKFKIEVSDTQAYRQFGNAVVVPVVQAVAKSMAPYLARDLAAAISPWRAVAG